MSLKPPRINKILEIDIDTHRNPEVIVKQLTTTAIPGRNPIDPTHNLIHNMQGLISGLMSSILKAEAKGICKKGEAMKTAIDSMTQIYVNTNTMAGSSTVEINPDGTIVAGTHKDL